jgi:hypothetical protein
MSGNSSPAPESASDEDVLRTAFIEMLFALAAGQVAVEVFDVVSAKDNTGIPKYYCYAHLTLALFVIAASWVGWRQSVSPGMKSKVKRIFSLAFVGLMIDVILVLLYFIVVKAAEIGSQNGEPVLTAPSASPEASWISIVFGVYVIWDLFADVFETDCIPSRVNVLSKPVEYCWVVGKLMFVSTFASALCLGLCLFSLHLANSVGGFSVLLVDLMLLAAVIIFRAAKGLEKWLAPALGVEDCKAFEKPREIGNSDVFWGTFMAVAYIAAAFLAAKYP